MNEKALRILEYPKIIDMLNQYGLPWVVDENPQTVE